MVKRLAGKIVGGGRWTVGSGQWEFQVPSSKFQVKYQRPKTQDRSPKAQDQNLKTQDPRPKTEAQILQNVTRFASQPEPNCGFSEPRFLRKSRKHPAVFGCVRRSRFRSFFAAFLCGLCDFALKSLPHLRDLKDGFSHRLKNRISKLDKTLHQ